MSQLRQLAKMELVDFTETKSVSPTEKLSRLFKVHPEKATKLFEKSKQLGDLWKRSRHRKLLSRSQNQGIPPTMGWPLYSGVHVAYKRGLLGQGIGVVLLDTSIWEQHPDLLNVSIIRMGEDDDTEIDERQLPMGTELLESSLAIKLELLQNLQSMK